MSTTSPPSDGTAGLTVRQRLERLTVGETMSAGVVGCSLETRLTSVARLMATHGVHGVFVFDYGAEDDEDVQVAGVVSDLDLVAAAARPGAAFARDAARTPLVTVTADDRLLRAAELMAERQVSHLAVLDPVTGRPAGVLSALDVARSISGLESRSSTKAPGWRRAGRTAVR
jgi:CBS domain-containing protein